MASNSSKMYEVIIFAIYESEDEELYIEEVNRKEVMRLLLCWMEEEEEVGFYMVSMQLDSYTKSSVIRI